MGTKPQKVVGIGTVYGTQACCIYAAVVAMQIEREGTKCTTPCLRDEASVLRIVFVGCTMLPALGDW